MVLANRWPCRLSRVTKMHSPTLIHNLIYPELSTWTIMSRTGALIITDLNENAHNPNMADGFIIFKLIDKINWQKLSMHSKLELSMVALWSFCNYPQNHSGNNIVDHYSVINSLKCHNYKATRFWLDEKICVTIYGVYITKVLCYESQPFVMCISIGDMRFLLQGYHFSLQFF